MDRRDFLRLTALGCACCALPACSTTGTVTGGPAIRTDLIPDGRYGRHKKFPLRVRYITIHSTGSPGGTAAAHARLLSTGRIRAKTQWNRRGYNFWHYTVDDREIVQHLPLNEVGEHADHDGPGNATSIGIEICEFREPARQRAAIERAAKLAAWLRRKYGLPLHHVVPHYHWTMHRFNHWNKPCPRILMDGGRPGRKWNAFLGLVSRS